MQNKVFYFIGIGGIGMSSIARYLMELGAQVGGYEKPLQLSHLRWRKVAPSSPFKRKLKFCQMHSNREMYV